jgi:catechol 2,3-dioxygenase-like lactoylglutathione lyase family enzyme
MKRSMPITSRAISKLITQSREDISMQIKLTSVFVDDQDKALKFYTEVLGFKKKLEFPAGKYKWLTVVSPEEPEGVQLVLEPNSGYGDNNTTAKTYQQEIFRNGIPAANFFVGDVQQEYARLKQQGVTFTKEPTKTTGSTIAVLDDTCGNLIQITHLDW